MLILVALLVSATAKLVKRFSRLPRCAHLLANARFAKRFAGLPPAAPPFSSQRNVGQRCARDGSVVR